MVDVHDSWKTVAHIGGKSASLIEAYILFDDSLVL